MFGDFLKTSIVLETNMRVLFKKGDYDMVRKTNAVTIGNKILRRSEEERVSE
jgi:hypothetical protein